MPISTKTDNSLTMRAATPTDVPELCSFIRDLAAHEGRPELATISPERLTGLLFGEKALGRAFIGFAGEVAAAYAIVAERFSSFRGRRFLYIEDMLVRPEFRGGGTGRQVLAFLAREATSMGCDHMEWSALDNNDVALGFYDHLGASREDGVVHFSLEGEAFDKLMEN